jgi:hypothetical protein
LRESQASRVAEERRLSARAGTIRANSFNVSHRNSSSPRPRKRQRRGTDEPALQVSHQTSIKDTSEMPPPPPFRRAMSTVLRRAARNSPAPSAPSEVENADPDDLPLNFVWGKTPKRPKQEWHSPSISTLRQVSTRHGADSNPPLVRSPLILRDDHLRANREKTPATMVASGSRRLHRMPGSSAPENTGSPGYDGRKKIGGWGEAKVDTLSMLKNTLTVAIDYVNILDMERKAKEGF